MEYFLRLSHLYTCQFIYNYQLQREDNTGETKTKALENRSMFLKILQSIYTYLDLKLVKEPIFLIMVLSVMAMSVGVPHVLFFVPTYSQSMKMNIDPAFLLSATSVADLIGRIAFGFILDVNSGQNK